MILVWFLDLKFLHEGAATMVGTNTAPVLPSAAKAINLKREVPMALRP